MKKKKYKKEKHTHQLIVRITMPSGLIEEQTVVIGNYLKCKAGIMLIKRGTKAVLNTEAYKDAKVDYIISKLILKVDDEV